MFSDLCVVFQNIHSATQDFEVGQTEEKQKFIQASPY